MKKFLCTALLLICLIPTMAQDKFVDDDKFIKNLSTYVQSASSQTADEIKTVFADQWKDGVISRAQKDTILVNLNFFAAKNLATKSFMVPYLQVIMGIFQGQEHVSTYFDGYHLGFDPMKEEKNTRKMVDFYEKNNLFFKEQKFREETSTIWAYSGGTPSFELQKKKLVITIKNTTLINRVPEAKNIGEAKRDYTEVEKCDLVYYPSSREIQGSGGTVDWSFVDETVSKGQKKAILTTYKIRLASNTLKSDSARFFSKKFPGGIYGTVIVGTSKSGKAGDYPQFTSYDKRLELGEIFDQVFYVGGYSIKGKNVLGSGSNAQNAQIIFYHLGDPLIKLRSLSFRFDANSLDTRNAKATVYLGNKDSIYHPGLNVQYANEQLRLVRPDEGTGLANFVDTYHMLEVDITMLTWQKGTDKINFEFTEGGQERRIGRITSMNFYDQQLVAKLQSGYDKNPIDLLYDFVYQYDEFVVPEGRIATVLGGTVSQVKPTILDLIIAGFLKPVGNGKVQITDKVERYHKHRNGTLDYDNLVFDTDLRGKRDHLQGQTEEDVRRFRLVKQREQDKGKMMSYKDYPKEQREQDSILTAKSEEILRENIFDLKKRKPASIDLTSRNMTILGVNIVPVSNASQVFVAPDRDSIVVGKNRDFTFSGWLNAGKVELRARKAKFYYEDWKFDLPDNELLRLRLPDETEKLKLRSTSHLENVIGQLLINDPSDRSVTSEEFGDYPKMIIEERSNIYYDHDYLYRGAYERDRFYVNVPAFTIDSLKTFSQKDFRIEGTLVSADIFPDIPEKFKLMPDRSFGFVQDSPEEGYVFYKDEKAKYKNTISLSNEGLIGRGEIKFILASASSEKFTFLPDSAMGMSNDFLNKESEEGATPEYAEAKATKAFIVYAPYQKTFKAYSAPRNEISMYGPDPVTPSMSAVGLQGKVFITPEGMTADGFMYFVNARLGSKDFDCKRRVVYADTASFYLSSLDANEIAMKSDNVNARVDFDERKGYFETNEGESKIDFPANNFHVYMDRFVWGMSTSDLSLEKDKPKADQNVNISTAAGAEESNFYSYDPKKDSLQFLAPRAKYSVAEKTIYCREVDHVDIADARIFPDTGYMVILPKGKVQLLTNAKILANTFNQYHNMYDVECQINTGLNYKASGLYDYYDIDSNRSVINLVEIAPDTTYQTYAKGKVHADSNFMLSPYFAFYGDVQMHASEQFLNFKGATRTFHDCQAFTKSWMSFEERIDPNAVMIPVTNPMKDLEGNAIGAGLLFNISEDQEVNVYPTFLSAQRSDKDTSIISAGGYLYYNVDSKEYIIANKTRLEQGAAAYNLAGNYVALHTGTCSMSADGKMTFGLNLGEKGNIAVNPVGKIDYNPNANASTMAWSGQINFMFDQEKMKEIAKAMVEDPEINGFSPFAPGMFFEKSINNTFDEKTADGVIKDLSKANKKLGPEMQAAFYFADVSMKVKETERGLLYYSTGPVKIATIGGEKVFKEMPEGACNIYAFKGRKGGDYIIIEIRLPGKMYTFELADVGGETVLTVYSNDETWLSLLEVKEGKRKDGGKYLWAFEEGSCRKLKRIKAELE